MDTRLLPGAHVTLFGEGVGGGVAAAGAALGAPVWWRRRAESRRRAAAFDANDSLPTASGMLPSNGTMGAGRPVDGRRAYFLTRCGDQRKGMEGQSRSFTLITDTRRYRSREGLGRQAAKHTPGRRRQAGCTHQGQTTRSAQTD